MTGTPLSEAFSRAAKADPQGRFMQQAALTLLPLIANALGQQLPAASCDEGADKKV